MRASEFITEAHHSILKTMTIGQWRVLIDSHAVVSMAARNVSPITFSNIITYACIYPDIAATIPIGKGAYVQDTNTLVSVYIHRLSENEIRVETVLGPDMKPKSPMFRRPIPSTTRKTSPIMQQNLDYMSRQAQQYGRDAVSQKLATIAPYSNLNRADRRAFNRVVKRKK
jgi:hypothetical protein